MSSGAVEIEGMYDAHQPDGLLFQKRRDEIYKEPHGRHKKGARD